MRSALVWLLAAVVPMAGGCEIVRSESLTAKAWLPAGQARAVEPYVGGVLLGPRPGDRALVVIYHALGNPRDVAVRIPLDPAGRPAGPFAVVGPVRIDRDPSGIQTAVVPSLTAAERAVLFARADATAVDLDAFIKRENAGDWHPVRTWRQSTLEWFQAPDHPDRARVLAFRIGPGDAVSEDVVRPGTGDPAPDGPTLVLVPESVARPSGDQSRDTAAAVALTPVTVGVDAVQVVMIGALTVIVTPFFLISGITRHAP